MIIGRTSHTFAGARRAPIGQRSKTSRATRLVVAAEWERAGIAHRSIRREHSNMQLQDTRAALDTRRSIGETPQLPDERFLRRQASRVVCAARVSKGCSSVIRHTYWIGGGTWSKIAYVNEIGCSDSMLPRSLGSQDTPDETVRQKHSASAFWVHLDRRRALAFWKSFSRFERTRRAGLGTDSLGR